MTRYLTAEQVLFIHARMIDETGGEHGIRDLGLVQAAIARPQATFDGEELYPDLFTKAAALMESLVNNHAFLDGNKRTGIAAVALFLQINGVTLDANNPQFVAFIMQVAQSKISVGKISNWLKNHRHK
ncbi:MAG: type II toxin-antitoxin system death-on-curing family toxin [Chloroflexi bacterium]|nr:type II toxin-antitoxin system death-on-curing family toxin [Chloroflexota bacterium]